MDCHVVVSDPTYGVKGRTEPKKLLDSGFCQLGVLPQLLPLIGVPRKFDDRIAEQRLRRGRTSEMQQERHLLELSLTQPAALLLGLEQRR